MSQDVGLDQLVVLSHVRISRPLWPKKKKEKYEETDVYYAVVRFPDKLGLFGSRAREPKQT
jgi:hypothetical protein